MSSMQMFGVNMPNMMPHLPARLPMQTMFPMNLRLQNVSLPRLPLALPLSQPQLENKTMTLEMLRKQSFTPLKEEVLTATLDSMKMPTTKENVSLAKTMVQTGVPLTQENMKELKTALASLPAVKSSDMQAAAFLKSASLMPTPQNITTLSNFITTNPQLGACFFEINREFRKMTDNSKGKISFDKMTIMSKTSKLMGDLVMQPGNKGSVKNARAFKQMAGQAGIQLPNYMMGSQDDELSELFSQLRAILFKSGDRDQGLTKELEHLLQKTEDAMMAQKLINTAQREGKENFYYFQIPLRSAEQDLTAEIKLYYTTDYDGRKVIDRDNFEFELMVPSLNLGTAHFHVKVLSGIITAQVGMETPEYSVFMAQYLPVLAERISLLGYSINEFSTHVTSGSGNGSMAMNLESFEAMEALDLSY